MIRDLTLERLNVKLAPLVANALRALAQDEYERGGKGYALYRLYHEWAKAIDKSVKLITDDAMAIKSRNKRHSDAIYRARKRAELYRHLAYQVPMPDLSKVAEHPDMVKEIKDELTKLAVQGGPEGPAPLVINNSEQGKPTVSTAGNIVTEGDGSGSFKGSWSWDGNGSPL